MLTHDQVQSSADWIASVQLDSGAIPWFTGGHLDPWDHGQAAMGLAAAGHHDRALAAWNWLANNQREDGSWAIKYWPETGEIGDPSTDANFTAYIATGVAHSARLGLDVEHLWPNVDAALECALSLRTEDGVVRWARDLRGRLTKEVLLTPNCSIAMSLRRGHELAERWEHARDHWLEAAQVIETAVAERPDLFTPKPKHSMDWYYPMLCGVLTGQRAEQRLAARWDEFVVPDLGTRCVVPNPWVTGGETCELVLALEAMGHVERAEALLSDIDHLREDDGSWWTGLVFDEDLRWPEELSTWTAGTAILAWDALTRTTPAATIFHRSTQVKSE